MMRSLLLAAVLVLVGCVSTPILPEYSPRVITVQNSDGLVTLSWKSETGYAYRIYFLNEKDNTWKPLKGVDQFIGTGKSITISDQRRPGDRLPWYSVRAKKL
ncbi:MAG: hypothetical protein K9M54_03295 [Kiritimatiellales bacterium]|nr:hypothetical protein [Kiritimatiellales bacterium]